MKRTYSQYEIEEANKIPILDVAKRLNIEVHGRKPILCPFHNERTPSLNFNLRNNTWKCFGCGEGGNVICFVMKFQDISFPEAVAWIRGDLNFRINPATSNTQKIIKQEYKNEPNIEIYEHFHALCINSEIVNNFYLHKKKIQKEILKEANIKILGDPHHVSSELLRCWSIKKLKDCGIFIEKVNTATGEILSSLYWYEPETVIIPFFNETSKITYLKGRLLSVERGHRNLKDCKTEIYNRIILSKLNAGDDLYLCEGETDTLSALSMGFNAVGFLGASSFEKGYVELLKNYNLYVVPDNDKAGVNFFHSIREAFFAINKPVNRISIKPNYKDLNEYYASEYYR